MPARTHAHNTHNTWFSISLHLLIKYCLSICICQNMFMFFVVFYFMCHVWRYVSVYILLFRSISLQSYPEKLWNIDKQRCRETDTKWCYCCTISAIKIKQTNMGVAVQQHRIIYIHFQCYIQLQIYYTHSRTPPIRRMPVILSLCAHSVFVF